MEKIYIKYKPYDDKQLKEACEIMEEMQYQKEDSMIAIQQNRYGILVGDEKGFYYTVTYSQDFVDKHFKLIKDLTKEEQHKYYIGEGVMIIGNKARHDLKKWTLGFICDLPNKNNDCYSFSFDRFGELYCAVYENDIESLTKEEFKVGDTIEVINKDLKSNYGYVYNIKKIEGDYIVTDENLDFKKSSVKKVYLDGMDNTDEHEEDYQFKAGDRVQLENEGTWYHYKYGEIISITKDGGYYVNVDDTAIYVQEDELADVEEQTKCDSSIKDYYIKVKDEKEAITAIKYFIKSGYQNFDKDLESIIRAIEDFEGMSIYINNYGNIDYTYNIEAIMKGNTECIRAGLKGYRLIDSEHVEGLYLVPLDLLNIEPFQYCKGLESNIDYLNKDEHIKEHHYCKSIYDDTTYIDIVESYGYALNNLTNNNNIMNNLNIETEALELETNKYFENTKTQKEIIKVKDYLEDKENNLSIAEQQIEIKKLKVYAAKNLLIESANNKDIAVVKDILKQFKADKEFLDTFIKTKIEDFKDDEVVEEEYNPESKWN